MKQPTQKTWELIRGLHAGQSFWEKLTSRHEHPLWEFEQIAVSGEALAIPHLTSSLLQGREDMRVAAARAIGGLIQLLSPSEFSQLDEACRNAWAYESPATSAWRRLKPSDLTHFRTLPNAPAVFGVTSFHGSGFIREAAVKELANIPDGSELPFLLVRLNDWVGVVRESAATAVRARIRAEYAAHFFQHLRLVLRLRSCGRVEHEPLVSAVTALFQAPGASPLLRQGILSNDRWLRRESFRMATAARSADAEDLLRELLADTDPIMRLWAARNLVPRLKDAELKPVLAALVRDRFMPVRCEALNLLAQRPSLDPAQALHAALLDLHASVRALARYWIRTQQPGFDFASAYRVALAASSPRQQRAAVLGLGETGTRADADAVAPFLRALHVGTRKAAVRSLAVLDAGRFEDDFIAALMDAHPGISNEATRALASKMSFCVERVHALFRAESPLHVRKNLVKLLSRLPFWQRGVFLFEAIRDRDEHIVELGRRALRDWIEHSRSMATPPSRGELQQVRDALETTKGMLAPHEVKELEFWLRTCA